METKRRALIIGGGQFSEHLLKTYRASGIEVSQFLDRFSINPWEYSTCPASEKLKEIVERGYYTEYVWTLATTNTRICEMESSQTMIANTLLPIWFANLLESYSISLSMSLQSAPVFIFIGSGCIFDGNDCGKFEWSKPTPHIEYANQKLMAECAIRDIYSNHLILRPRMLFSDKPVKSNLLYKIATFTDLIHEPNSMTSVDTLADFIVQMNVTFTTNKKKRTFNIANDGMFSPLDIKIMMSAIHGLPLKVNIISIDELFDKVKLQLTNTCLVSEWFMFKDLKREMMEVIERSSWIKDVWKTL